MEVENLTVADVAYPFVTNRVMSVFQQQLIHVRNGCIWTESLSLSLSGCTNCRLLLVHSFLYIVCRPVDID